MKDRQPGRMTVHFEAQLSHVRTAFLWDLGLNMQPCLTSSALLSMAASAASLLASNTQPTLSSPAPANTALLDMVATGPQQLPSAQQMVQNPSCNTLQLSVALAAGSLRISCNGATQMQAVIRQAGTEGSFGRATPEGCAGGSPGALACMLQSSIGGQPAAFTAAALAHVACPGDESGYSLHPAVFEVPVSLAALTAQPGKAQPTWIKSSSATLVPLASATAGFAVSSPLSSCKAWSTDHQPILQQEGVLLASGLAVIAPDSPIKEAAATAAAGLDVTTGDQEAQDQVVSPDSVLLRMDSQERKLYIQAQVCTGPAFQSRMLGPACTEAVYTM